MTRAVGRLPIYEGLNPSGTTNFKQEHVWTSMAELVGAEFHVAKLVKLQSVLHVSKSVNVQKVNVMNIPKPKVRKGLVTRHTVAHRNKKAFTRKGKAKFDKNARLSY